MRQTLSSLISFPFEGAIFEHVTAFNWCQEHGFGSISLKSALFPLWAASTRLLAELIALNLAKTPRSETYVEQVTHD